MTINLTEIYDVTLKKETRDAARGGFVRPTLGQSFMSSKDFVEVIARAIPGAPTIGTVTLDNGSAVIPFTAPGNNGNSPILYYTATSTPGNLTGTVNQAGSGSITISGLTVGVSYTFKITATNIMGTSAESDVSNSVFPTSAPGIPTVGTVTVSDVTASVPFTAPANNGGSTILSYTATSTPGNITGTLNQAGSGTITVSGLTASTSYTFKVKATNAVGTGLESTSSNSVVLMQPIYFGGVMSATLSNSNLTVTSNGQDRFGWLFGTRESGKWFAEFHCTADPGPHGVRIGVFNPQFVTNTYFFAQPKCIKFVPFIPDGSIYCETTGYKNPGAIPTAVGDFLGCAYDVGTGKFDIYKNGVLITSYTETNATFKLASFSFAAAGQAGTAITVTGLGSQVHYPIPQGYTYYGE